jgi:coenzyme F420-reducing hydrogenase alpha subunit
MLHAPDFLGYESGIAMAADHGDVVAQALELKKIGNRLMTVVGGREVHPINVRVGGWYRAPRPEELTALVPDLERAREIALAAVKLVAGFDFPDYERDYELVCLRHPGEYPIDRGRIVSNRGLDIPVEEYPEHFVEEHVAWSTALHSSVRERGAYLCGPLARFALNAEELSPLAREAARDAGLEPSERNPFRSILVRCVELVYATDEALRLIAAYEQPELPALDLQPRAGTGHGCTEAPRGILYHRYTIDADGTILDADIIPPTSQNQHTIEDDLRAVVERSLDVPDEQLTLLCEQTIRNYDPCISCSTHFLTLEIDRD